jgi:protein gp37
VADTTIEWTHKTWNPVRGCSLESEGSRNCYAQLQAHRFSGKGKAYEALTRLTKHGPVWTGDIRLVPELLDEPLRWKKPSRVFVNSMSDLFHPGVPQSYVEQVADVMRRTDRHTFQVLTKRAERMREQLSCSLRWAAELPNVWWGVSVENRKQGVPRIAHLQETPATMRFLSIEPLLEDLGQIDLRGIHWVIVGGESGPKARPMQPEWVHSILDQCRAARVPFFFKQWGGVHKKKAGRMLDGEIYDEFPAHYQVF